MSEDSLAHPTAPVLIEGKRQDEAIMCTSEAKLPALTTFELSASSRYGLKVHCGGDEWPGTTCVLSGKPPKMCPRRTVRRYQIGYSSGLLGILGVSQATAVFWERSKAGCADLRSWGTWVSLSRQLQANSAQRPY